MRDRQILFTFEKSWPCKINSKSLPREEAPRTRPEYSLVHFRVCPAAETTKRAGGKLRQFWSYMSRRRIRTRIILNALRAPLSSVQFRSFALSISLFGRTYFAFASSLCFCIFVQNNWVYNFCCLLIGVYLHILRQFGLNSALNIFFYITLGRNACEYMLMVFTDPRFARICVTRGS